MLYDIDIVGSCNLRCPSCAVGNYSATLKSLPQEFVRPRGLMKLDLFERILDKIKKEHEKSGKRVAVSLFIWGEPLLHPKIGEFIASISSRGFDSLVSTNLNVSKYLAEVVKAKPGRLRISLSGATQATYGETHTRGDIEVVKANARKLRHLMDQHDSQFPVEMHYHLYNHNIFSDAREIRDLCDELNFEFRPGVAFFMPLEKRFALAEGEAISAADTEVLARMLVLPMERAAIVQESNVPDCVLRSEQVAINCDGSVSLCCGTYDPRNIVVDSYLDHSFEVIQKIRYGHSTCERCFSHGFAVSEYTGSTFRKVVALARERVTRLGGDPDLLGLSDRHIRDAFQTIAHSVWRKVVGLLRSR